MALFLGWSVVLIALLWSVGRAVRAGDSGFVLLALPSLSCVWLLVVVRLLPDWRGKCRPKRKDQQPP